VGTVGGAAGLEVVEVALLAGGGLAQIDTKLFESADANLHCLVVPLWGGGFLEEILMPK
jgi:hypothetical protein